MRNLLASTLKRVQLLSCSLLLIFTHHSLAGVITFERLLSDDPANYSDYLTGNLVQGDNDNFAFLDIANNSNDLFSISRILLQDSNKAIAFNANTYTVTLTSFGNSKLAVIKAVKELTGLSLKEAKELVEKAPTNLVLDTTEADADRYRQSLIDAGAEFEINATHTSPSITLNDSPQGLVINSDNIWVPGNVVEQQVILTSFGTSKLSVIKVVKELIPELSLAQVKTMVENLPATIPGDADYVKNRLEDVGATVKVEDIGTINELITPDFELVHNSGLFPKDFELAFGLTSTFDELLTQVNSQSFKLMLELQSAQGSSLYAAAINSTDSPTQVPEPRMFFLLTCGLLALLLKRAKSYR